MDKILSQRFYYRLLDASDANENYLSWLADKDTKQFIINKVGKIKDLEAYISQCKQNNSSFLFGIFLRDSNEHIGNIKFELTFDHIAEMGILIGDNRWRGKGVANEAIITISKYLQTHYDVKRIVLGVAKNNLAAIKAYEKIGFVLCKEPLSHYEPETGILMIWHLDD